MKTELKQCSAECLDTLQDLCIRTFRHAFESQASKEIMDSYLKETFSQEKLKEEITSADSAVYILYVNEEPAGYLKLNYYNAQTNLADPNSIEIARIYLTKEMQSKGLGHILMNKAVHTAIEMEDIEYIWLRVWENNTHAIEFYEKNGYEIVGRLPFYIANLERFDYVMRKDLY